MEAENISQTNEDLGGELKEGSRAEAPAFEEEEEEEEADKEVGCDSSFLAWAQDPELLCHVMLDYGIIDYARQKNRLPNVTASSISQDNHPQNALHRQGFFRSDYDEPERSWLLIDFKDACVAVEDCRICFGDNAVRFVLEGSTDGDDWLTLGDGNPWPNEWTKTDAVKSPQQFRFLRLRSKQDYLGDVKAFEFFGTLFIDGMAVRKPYCVMERAF